MGRGCVGFAGHRIELDFEGAGVGRAWAVAGADGMDSPNPVETVRDAAASCATCLVSASGGGGERAPAQYHAHQTSCATCLVVVQGGAAAAGNGGLGVRFA